MIATIVILPTVEEQRAAGDSDIIDPAVVKLAGEAITLWRDFNFRVPEDALAKLTNIRVENGRLVADVEAYTPYFESILEDQREGRPALLKYGIMGLPTKFHLEHDPLVRVIEDLDLLAVGATHVRPAKPAS